MKHVRRRNAGPSRKPRIRAILVVLVLAAAVPVTASAQIELPELPVDEPLQLGDLLNVEELLQGELPVSTDVEELGDAVSGLLGGTAAPPKVLKGKKSPRPAPAPSTPQTGSWSTEGLLPSAVAPNVVVSSNRVPAPSYGAAVGNGLFGAARRAADLAGPVAAPMMLGLFAVGLLFVAARGPGRLVKVEEERKAFREQRTYRL